MAIRRVTTVHRVATGTPGFPTYIARGHVSDPVVHPRSSWPLLIREIITLTSSAMNQSEQPQVLDLQKARAQIQKLLPRDEDLAQRAEEILIKIIPKSTRVYETDRASIGLPAVAAYLACEEWGLLSAIPFATGAYSEPPF